MEEKKTVLTGGVGFWGLLTILFIALKLTNYVNWSWWWVLSPIWLPTTLVLGGAIIFGLGWLAYHFITEKRGKK